MDGAIVGHWQSSDDALSWWSIGKGPSGHHATEMYDGDQDLPQRLVFVSDCASRSPASSSSLIFVIGDGRLGTCYAIEELGDGELVLASHPDGDRLAYRRVD